MKYARIIKRSVLDCLVQSGHFSTVSHPRRLIKQGAVKVNGVKVTSFDHIVADGDTIHVGKQKVNP